MIAELQEAVNNLAVIYQLHHENQQRVSKILPQGTFVEFTWRHKQKTLSTGHVVSCDYNHVRIRFSGDPNDWRRKVIDIPFRQIHSYSLPQPKVKS